MKTIYNDLKYKAINDPIDVYIKEINQKSNKYYLIVISNGNNIDTYARYHSKQFAEKQVEIIKKLINSKNDFKYTLPME